MTNEHSTFARPDLFERDTWNKQVFDLHSVINAVAAGKLPGERAQGDPIMLIGHSRGSVTAILAAARLTEVEKFPDQPSIAGIITLAAPARCNPLTLAEQADLLQRGWIESPSSRTGQRLRIGRAFLQEQIDYPKGHDVLGAVAKLTCPMLVIHGDADGTVPASDARQIAAASGNRGQLHVIEHADHVLNTPNPLPAGVRSSPQLSEALDAMVAFIKRVLHEP